MATKPIDAKNGENGMDAKTAMGVGMRIAEEHQAAVLSMMKSFPHLTPEQALHGNSVWLGAQIMTALQESSSDKRT